MSIDAGELNGKQIAEQSKNLCVENCVSTLIAGYLGQHREKFKVTSSFRDLGANRLELFCFGMDLEAAFGLGIPDINALRFITVGDTVWWILHTQMSHSGISCLS